MALFWSKKPKAEKNYDSAKTVKATKAAKPASKAAKDKVASKEVVAPKALSTIPAGTFGAAAEAIIRPHITEKSGVLSQSGSYTFVVAKGATKSTVSKAISALYKVVPTKVAVLNQPSKTIIVKGRRGTVSGFRKAVVTLKKGEKIDFV